MQTIRQKVRNLPWLGILVFVLVAVFAGFATPRHFPYDSGYYWELRQTFYDSQGNFSLTNYADERYQLRGYIIPLWLLAGEWLIDVPTPDRWVDDYLTVVLLNTALFTLLACALLPGLFTQLTGKAPPLRVRLLLALTLFLFLRGYISYPLSDLPALVFLLAGLLALLWVARLSAPGNLAVALLAGALLAAAYFARPVYLLAFGAAGLSFFFIPSRRWGWKGLAFAAFLVGGALIALPQYQVNRIHYGVDSPFISGGLYTFQTTVGMRVQRYETNLNEQIYPLAGVTFLDPQAENLLQRAGRLDVLAMPLLQGVFNLEHTISLSDIFSLFLPVS